MRWYPRILRRALLGAVIGIVLLRLVEWQSPDGDWRLAAAGVVLGIARILGRRWIRTRRDDHASR